MSTKIMNVDTRSKIAGVFLNFAKNQSKGYPLNKKYLLRLNCTDNNEVVLVTIYERSFPYKCKESKYSMDEIFENPDIVTIAESFEKMGVEIDSFEVEYSLENQGTIYSIKLNTPSIGTYFFNKETNKLELHFDKDTYMSLSDEDKSDIKSNYLFSRKSEAWVSRAKFPNLWRAEAVANRLGLTNLGSVGETLSYREQLEVKAEKAENRATRYEAKSEKAIERGNNLQKPIHDMHGDIAFFTQPNINSSAGRAFTNKRNKMFAAYEKGFEEFKKSEYYAERAEIARATASGIKPTDKGFCLRRIEEAEKVIKAQKKNLEAYKEKIKSIESGKVLKRYDGSIVSVNEIQEYIEKSELLIEQSISKSVYYHECLEELGGIGFSKENIKNGYIVELKRRGRCLVDSTGPKNISYTILDGGAKGLGGSASYAEIVKIISSENNLINYQHPFKVGEKYTVKHWNGDNYEDKEFIITKTTQERVTLKSGTDKAITRKPRRFRNGSSDKNTWALCIYENLNGTIYKKEEDINE